MFHDKFEARVKYGIPSAGASGILGYMEIVTAVFALAVIPKTFYTACLLYTSDAADDC